MSLSIARLGALMLAAAVVAGVGRPLVLAWLASPYATQGPLVCLFSAYAAWRLRGALPRARWRPGLPAAAAALLALATLAGGHAANSLPLQALALPLGALAITLLAYGPRGARVLAFPLAFLVAAVPLPASWLAALSSLTQHAAASVAHRTLEILGIPVLREGLTLEIGKVSLEITEACNGLRFLFVSIIAGLAVAWALRRPLSERALVIALALAGGLAANLVRVTGTAILAWVEPAAVIGTPHLVFGRVVYLAVGGATTLVVAARLRRPTGRSAPRAVRSPGSPA